MSKIKIVDCFYNEVDPITLPNAKWGVVGCGTTDKDLTKVIMYAKQLLEKHPHIQEQVIRDYSQDSNRIIGPWGPC